MRTNIQTVLKTFIWAALLTPLVTWGAIFTAQTTAEIETALTVAATNGEDDTINISSGTYSLAASLAYQSNENNSLTIQSSGGAVTLDAQAQNYRGLFIRTHAENAHITLKGITIINGRISYPGAGGGAYIYAANADITIENSSFTDNAEDTESAPINAAGLFVKSGGGNSIVLNGNDFRRNSTNGMGGGLHVSSGVGSDVTLVNNVFYDNEASAAGGGAYISVITGALTLTNNTFNRNAAGNGGGGGLYARLFYNCTVANIFNNIFWENTAQNGIGEDLYVLTDGNNNGTGATVFIEHNSYLSLDYDVADNLSLVNNIDQNPLFETDPTDLRLTRDSPAINAGTNTAPSLPALDFDGEPRDGQPDMGAFEHQWDPSDLDGDGMPNTYEDQYTFLNLLDPLDAGLDEDGDGLTNLQEYQAGTDPAISDTDGDGMSDQYENQYAVLNPLDPSDAGLDEDGDGLTNLQEYQAGTDPANSDTDGDGLSDKYEIENNLDPTSEDTDRDGMADGYELDNGYDPTDSSDCPSYICGSTSQLNWRKVVEPEP